MRLYTSTLAPSGRRVGIFAAEKGLDPAVEEIDLKAGENLSEPFRQRNPFGLIPVLELDDGGLLSESIAICRYFESLVPEPRLFGRDGREQAEVEMWNRRAELSFLLPVAMAFRHRSGYFQDRETVVPEWGEAMAGTAARTAPLFDRHLARHRYLAGEHYSVADITLAVALEFARRTRCALPEGLEHLSRWRDAVTARPSFALPEVPR